MSNPEAASSTTVRATSPAINAWRNRKRSPPVPARIAIEERASMSPDSLTGLEANLRFCQKESMETRIFGRLSAWQNWIFNRPNAVGEKGALKVYGKGEKPAFDLNRV